MAVTAKPALLQSAPQGAHATYTFNSLQLTYKVIFLAAIAAVPAWRHTIPTAPLLIFSAYVPLLVAVMPWKYATCQQGGKEHKEHPAGAGHVGEHTAAAASAGGRKEE